MILEDILSELRRVESGEKLLQRPLAKQAADTIELLLDRARAAEEQLRRFKELEAEGRIKVLPPVEGDKCGNCEHYETMEGSYGRCKVRKDRWKTEEPLRVARCRKACRDFRQKA